MNPIEDNNVDEVIVEATIVNEKANQESWRSLGIVKLIDEPRMMLAMLFFVTAGLGLPFLWMSRGFTVKAKFFWSIIITIYTVVILWIFYLVMMWSYQRVMDAIQ